MTIAEISTERMNIVIVGHVDHGKSTLVGRLLVDTGAIGQAKIDAVRSVCEKLGKPFEYAFLLDALKDERTQGITIDTARIFFRSAVREYIILDAPGHIEFLRNMVTGAARADAALLLIDAKEGIAENSRRHGLILSMLGVKKVVVLVNKMDLVEYDPEIFNFLRREYEQFLKSIEVLAQAFIPISAKDGDNIIHVSSRMAWYKGPCVLETLDKFESSKTAAVTALRMPVQDVYKFDGRRIVAGTVESGRLKIGDEVIFLPSEKTSRIETIESFGSDAQEEVAAGTATGVTLSHQIYVKPGEIMCNTAEWQKRPTTGTRFKAKIFWMGRQPLQTDKIYILKLATARMNVLVEEIEHVLDTESLKKQSGGTFVERNSVALCKLMTLHPFTFDLFDDFETTGRFVIVDNYQIAGGGTIAEALTTVGAEPGTIGAQQRDEFEHELNAFVRKWFPHWETKEIA